LRLGSDQVDRNGGGVAGYDYRRESSGSFDDSVAAVEAALGRHGFTVSAMHDIQATLASKGFAIKPIRIYEVNGPRDPAWVGQDAESPVGSKLGRLMPCRINVFVEDEVVVVTALRPTLLCRVFPEEDLDDVAAALERVLVAVVDEAVG
jgi:uncharacterized protein (DUF302 family)